MYDMKHRIEWNVRNRKSSRCATAGRCDDEIPKLSKVADLAACGKKAWHGVFRGVIAQMDTQLFFFMLSQASLRGTIPGWVFRNPNQDTVSVATAAVEKCNEKDPGFGLVALCDRIHGSSQLGRKRQEDRN